MLGWELSSLLPLGACMVRQTEKARHNLQVSVAIATVQKYATVYSLSFQVTNDKTSLYL